ncbi:MAG TPA: hypothetical protein VF077_12635 [Nitrospiraceae bacterium]
MHGTLKRWLTTSVTHRAYTGQDVYGTPTYAAPHTVLSRLEASVRRFVDSTGTERVSRSRLFLDELAVVSLRDQVTLPDGTRPPLLQVDQVLTPAGHLDHWEIFL